MFTIFAIIAILIAAVLIYAATRPDVPCRAVDKHQSAAGKDILTNQRLSSVGGLVALGKDRPGGQTHLQRCR